MVRSKATSAHTLVAVEVDFENVERVRRKFRDAFQEQEGGLHLTYLPFVSRAVIETLRNYPHLNASVGNDALIVHKDVHLGIAVDLGLEGLMVPVIHNADGQSLRGLARTIRRSRGIEPALGALSMNDITGGTRCPRSPTPVPMEPSSLRRSSLSRRSRSFRPMESSVVLSSSRHRTEPNRSRFIRSESWRCRSTIVRSTVPTPRRSCATSRRCSRQRLGR